MDLLFYTKMTYNMTEIAEKIKKNGWITHVFTPGIAIIILINTVMITRFLMDLEERSISTVEMRVRLEDHMESWTPVRQEKAFERLNNTEQGTNQNAKDIILLRIADSLAIVDRKEMKATLKRIETNTNKYIN